MSTHIANHAITATTSATPLQRFLALDAVVTGGNGLAYLVASGPVSRLLGVPSGLLAGIGTFLVLFGAAVGYLATRPRPPVTPVRAVIEANLLWAVTSLVVLAFGWLSPTTAGTVWIPLQAAIVAGFAVLQYTGLRRMLTAGG